MFPFDLPTPTAIYLSLYLLTLSGHVVLMSYVLAGTGYLAVAALRRGEGDDPIADRLRDWLPFALGAAITAGVAPLLFVQILYRESFYTANLLLFHRWMGLIPVLMLGFYLLYLGKSRILRRAAGSDANADSSPTGQRRSALAGKAVWIIAFLCFAATGYSWTENHLLSLDRDQWVSLYADGGLVYARPAVALRFAMWLVSTVPLMALGVAWQLARGAGSDREAMAGPVRRLAVLALGGLLASAILGVAYASVLPASDRALLTTPFGFLAIIAAGLMVQAAVWIRLWRAPQLSRGALLIASAAAVLAVIATALVREHLRLGTLADDALLAVHARAVETGGMIAFVVFLLLNTGIMVSFMRSVSRELKKTT